MQRTSHDWKVVSMRLRLTTQLLQLAGAAYRSGNETEYASCLSEASAIFRSIVATSLDGSGSDSITADTMRGPHMPFGTLQDSDGPHGSSVPES